MLKDRKVLIFGDSLARGVVWDEARSRYVLSPRAAVKRVAEETGMTILNRARMGMTAEGGLACMQADLDAGMTADTAIVVMAIVRTAMTNFTATTTMERQDLVAETVTISPLMATTSRMVAMIDDMTKKVTIDILLPTLACTAVERIAG